MASGGTVISSGGGLEDRYAAALYSHAEDIRALDSVVDQMETLGRLIDTSADFRRLLASPLIDIQTARRAALAVLQSEKRGVITAHVASAHALTDLQRQQLHARLIEAGYGNVNIAESVQPDLLGGLVVRVGARLYDTSLKSRLQRLQYAMKGAA